MKKWMLPIMIILLTACNASPQNEDGQAIEEEQIKVEDENQQNESDEEEQKPVEEASGSEDTSDTDEGDTSENGNEVENKINEPQYAIDPNDSSVIPLSDAKSEVVLLTIDDAPDRYALEMANTLKELNVKAIFFVNGHFLQTDEEQEILKKIHEMGFPIGNHTMNHKSLRQISEEEQYEEIVALSDLIEEIVGERPRFFRAPFGINTDYSAELVGKEGMVLMNWTYGYDWEQEYTNAEAIADIMVNTELLRNGANLLMHDREWTNAGLADIVKGLQEKGYDIVDPDLIEVPSEIKQEN
ncbi:polysaccharide deacetylase family protein [Sutcliffiella deserti]|uniref:polysaccharide deacetylase family protein n=1 Tax=Sutcliffiella deserti TaxID=2875501 RepID=UPI001CC09E68|nr:polysaccharide deacetylase family protein [Sutcliffiella deserti]